MNKEMMDKVNEILKKNGKRELSLDELDKVSGGIWFPEPEEEASFQQMFLDITATLGFDVAHELFMETTGYVTYAHRAFGDATDAEKMNIVLQGYWNLRDQEKGYH